MINRHKRLVMKRCFKMGLIRQGLLHDLSKYSLTEFLPGVKYFQGHRSPNVAEREEKGYSTAWLHHKGRNRHHLEYWTDYKKDRNDPGVTGCPMPDRYIAEMLADRLSACENYNGKNYTQADAYNYFMKNVHENSIIHPDTREKIVMLLGMVKDKGEDETFRYVREVFLKKR